ncbi:MAG: hypothetical protein ACLFWF_09780 [Alphaproteobacteria bacterium]
MDPRIRMALNVLGWIVVVAGSAGTVAGILQEALNVGWDIQFLPVSAFIAAPGVFLVLITRVPRGEDGSEGTHV